MVGAAGRSTHAHTLAMLDHLSLQCDDLERSATFYDAVLTTIGGRRIIRFDNVIGYGFDAPIFWIGVHNTGTGFRESHVAFRAPDRAAVDAFVEAARALRAVVLNEPKEWPEYHSGYYAGFVRDPDGNNVEAVSHG
jgi:catechol 2,3-dioxygenase-like lactoylglutathione lyase family enzyme